MRRALCPALFLLIASSLGAQTQITSNDLANVGTAKHVVRTAGGELYSLSASRDASGNYPLLLHRSADGGTSWTLEPFTFNDATSGLSGTLLANHCALAIDDLGVLHAVWGAYKYPSPYSQWYRNYDPATGTASAIVSISGVTGASTGSRTAANMIEVDQSNVVWIIAHGAGSWREQLVRSDNPYAAGLGFTDLGAISTANSAQQTDLAIDFNGLVHCSYYRNTGPGEYWHRVYDPAGGWMASSRLGNSSAPHDERGRLVADYLGNVHAIVGVDTGTPEATWSFEYRRWDLASGWSAPIVAFTATQAQYSGIANEQICDIACDPFTGTAYLAYRDLAAGGMLRVASKGLTDSGFTVMQDLTSPSMATHVFYRPNIRGSLFPASNNLNGTLDIVFQYRQTHGTLPYALLYDSVSTTPGPSLTVGGAPIAGTPFTVDLASVSDAGRPYLGAFSWSDTPGVPLPDSRVIPVNLDDLFWLSQTPNNGLFSGTTGTLDASGDASMLVTIPGVPGLSGLAFHAGAIAFEVSAPSGISTVFPGVQITLQ